MPHRVSIEQGRACPSDLHHLAPRSQRSTLVRVTKTTPLHDVRRTRRSTAVMSKLQNFVKGSRTERPESPRNGQSQVNQQRAIYAESLKVQMRPEVARPPPEQALHGRGESDIQHQSASLQQQRLQRGPSGEGQNHDQYDTDAESLDTTINHSVAQVEDTQQYDQQQFQPDDEELDSDGEDEAFDGDLKTDDVEISDDIQGYLAQHGQANVSHSEQIQFLRTTQPQLFETHVDGDSYPSTTDGIPTELEGQREQIIEDLGSPTPSPQRSPRQGSGASAFNQQPPQRNQMADLPHTNHSVQQNSKIFRQGAQIRGQQRFDSSLPAHTQSGQPQATFELPTNQPPTYSLTTREQIPLVPQVDHSRLDVVARGAPSGFPQPNTRMPSIPRYRQNSVPKIVEPVTTFNRGSATHTKIVPVIQQSIEPTVEENSEHLRDYGSAALSKMTYEQLRDESFDYNPREQGETLPEHMRDNPLTERLEFAHHNLDPHNQAKFFSALSTTEWECAGDWFLGQFSAVMTKTREARQKKRQRAQKFEEEIEARHNHVAKKQRLVERAMEKMQAQGEGLVPKSPRASKTPRPRRG